MLHYSIQVPMWSPVQESTIIVSPPTVRVWQGATVPVSPVCLQSQTEEHSTGSPCLETFFKKLQEHVFCFLNTNTLSVHVVTYISLSLLMSFYVVNMFKLQWIAHSCNCTCDCAVYCMKSFINDFTGVSVINKKTKNA